MFDDGFESSYPVYSEVNDPLQITNVYGSIRYQKALALMFMLESTVGSENFRDGLRV
jgi:aminopeptidase N